MGGFVQAISSIFTGPPKVSTPTYTPPPTPTDPTVQAAAAAEASAQASAAGRGSTLLTSGLGDTSQAPVQKKVLLGS